jgi:(1->4)-alpha-D-glucan 1-alpha-D-glucosylmutase
VPDRPVKATYRLQLHAGFGFDAARDLLPYLASLGISHLYLSPILQAAPGSVHGYDVVDHSRVSHERGGREALEQLASSAHDHGLGIVVDVVPNHMALPTPLDLNRQLWDTLRLGQGAPTANWFDIDWDLLGGRIGVPVLGASIDDVIAHGELAVDRLADQHVLTYHDQRFPLAPGTAHGGIAGILARQNYVLGSWRDKDRSLGYRRFFDIDTLIALRVELPEVFEATHRLLLDLYADGVIDGFRIDHPDGLADPQGYLEQLRDATDGGWVVVEKILEGDERLPLSWPVAGTTGYDAARVISRALSPMTGAGLDRRWRDTGVTASLTDVAAQAKRLVLDTLFQPELGRLTRTAVTAASDAGVPTRARLLREALSEILSRVGFYRAYLRPSHPADRIALDRLADQVMRAIEVRPELSETAGLLFRLLSNVDTDSAATRDLIVRFQQVCGPVMAKGVEDTTCYRWHRLVAVNEVGGDASELDPSDVPLHAWAAHQHQHHPDGLTTLSTHDTKRSEDVRSRLLAVAGDLTAWDSVWAPVRRRAADLDVDLPTAYLVMQTVLGTWPIGADRLTAYMRKATREAKQHTSWRHPDLDYEERVQVLARQCIEDPEIVDAVEGALTDNAAAVRAVTLGAKLLQLALPGVPDVYQGCESLDLSLVDPDNRRPVDFAALAQRLAELDAGKPPADLGEEKLLLTSRVLRLRRDLPDVLDGHASYDPLPTLPSGLIGFVRGERVVVVVSTGRGALVGDVRLPHAGWRDVLTDVWHASSTIPVGTLFAGLPIALLARAGEEGQEPRMHTTPVIR